jgi:hypothetical protein
MSTHIGRGALALARTRRGGTDGPLAPLAATSPRPTPPGWSGRSEHHSHSIVPGGLDVMSSTTRLTSRSSLIMREAICSSRS